MVILLLVLSQVPIFLCGQVLKLNQKKGIYQDDKSKQIQFIKYEKIDFSFNKLPLKKVEKIAIHNNKIFILDGKRSELYVIDKKGNHINTIGRPGQGPGDLEYPSDFFISKDNTVYVLNSMSRRVEVFEINGTPIKTIKLEEGSGIWIQSESIAVGSNGDLYISEGGDQILAVYSPKGDFKKMLLNRKHMNAYNDTPSRIGVSSSIELIDDRLYLLDLFTGILTNTSVSGELDAAFSAISHDAEKKIREIKNMFKDSKKQKYHKSYISLWSKLCVDESNRIYALLLYKKKGESQMIFVFSKKGDFLYSFPLVYFLKNRMAVRLICCDKEDFVFLTYDFNLILGTRRKL
jgi:hypothetical protein